MRFEIHRRQYDAGLKIFVHQRDVIEADEAVNRYPVLEFRRGGMLTSAITGWDFMRRIDEEPSEVEHNDNR